MILNPNDTVVLTNDEYNAMIDKQVTLFEAILNCTNDAQRRTIARKWYAEFKPQLLKQKR